MFFKYDIWWKYSNENWEVGIIKAKNRKEAENKLYKINPSILGCSISQLEFDKNNICSIYEH